MIVPVLTEKNRLHGRQRNGMGAVPPGSYTMPSPRSEGEGLLGPAGRYEPVLGGLIVGEHVVELVSTHPLPPVLSGSHTEVSSARHDKGGHMHRSIRGTARITGVSKTTILKLIEDLGRA